MGGVVSHDEANWFIANYEFREVLGRAKEKVARPDDAWKLDQAVALHGLHFDLLDDSQAQRLAHALGEAATELHAELNAREPRDAREAGFRDSLPALGRLVDGVVRRAG